MQIRKQTGSDTYVVLDDTTIYEVDMNCRRELERLRKMQGEKEDSGKKERRIAMYEKTGKK